jgi:putative AlgH/UPF0301 family transcriptional regulator
MQEQSMAIGKMFAARASLAIIAVVLTAGFRLAHAQSEEASQAVLLVASPKLAAFYEHSVLVAVPMPGNRHVGFIVNRPTTRTLATLFPEHAPSKKVVDPVYLGGPEMVNSIFAVVKSARDPGGVSFPFLPGLFVVADAPSVDKVIENTPNDARYYAGFVAWKPGELDAEFEQGFWLVLQPDAEVMFRKDADAMWEELLRRAHKPSSAGGQLRAGRGDPAAKG